MSRCHWWHNCETARAGMSCVPESPTLEGCALEMVSRLSESNLQRIQVLQGCKDVVRVCELHDESERNTAGQDDLLVVPV